MLYVNIHYKDHHLNILTQNYSIGYDPILLFGKNDWFDMRIMIRRNNIFAQNYWEELPRLPV